RHAHERMARYVHRAREARRRAVEEPALKVFLWRECDRVDKDVELAPLGCYRVEHGFERARDADVEGQKERSLERPCNRLDVWARLLVEIREREIGAKLAKGLGAAVCDRLVVGDSDDE